MNEITIGKLAELADVNVETIRFYHREDILKEPMKRSNGYRYYNDEHLAKIIFIKKVKELGFSLKEIKDLLEINTKPRATCDFVKEKVTQKVLEIDEKVKNLAQIKKSLREISKACDLNSSEMKKLRVINCFEKSCC